MRVLKRNGSYEDIDLRKIQARMTTLTIERGLDHLDTLELCQSVVAGLYDGVTTQQLDELAIETAAGLCARDPEYGKLAGALAVSNLDKNLRYDGLNTLGGYIHYFAQLHPGYIRDDILHFLAGHQDALRQVVMYDRDYLLDYFGYRTLEKSYLIKDTKSGKIVERPQHLWLRVAAELGQKDLDKVITIYNQLSTFDYMHATPTLFNAGTYSPQMASCFLLSMEDDSIEGIFKCLSDCAQISKYAGGIGVAITKIRAKGSPIKGTNGISNGIVPMSRMFNELARYIDQGGGKRKGAVSLYLEPWHPDVFDFLDLRKQQGKEEIRARDIFTALWIPDLFMERVERDAEWSLLCPNQCPGLVDVYGDEFKVLYESYENQGLAMRIVPARSLWRSILQSQIETGTPYMLYKDACNAKSNQKNLGTLKSSNLCVAPETKMLTRQGYFEIQSLWGKTVDVWNGDCWSETEVYKTGVNKKLIKVITDCGQELYCTEYHKFYVKNKYGSPPEVKRAHELVKGDKLEKFNLPEPNQQFVTFNPKLYTEGLYTADGCYTSTKFPHRVYLYGAKQDLAQYLLKADRSYNQPAQNRSHYEYGNLRPKYFIPTIAEDTVSGVLSWLAGYLDGDGCVTNNNGNQGIQVSSVNKDFLQALQLSLQELGVNSKIKLLRKAGNYSLPKNDGTNENALYQCRDVYRLTINGVHTKKLLCLGLPVKRLRITSYEGQREAEKHIKVISIVDEGRHDDTYCVTETLKNKVMFNGLLTGNCVEILEYTCHDEIAVCNLASINLSKLVENGTFNYKRLGEITEQLVINLNSVLDSNYYKLPETSNSNLKRRPVGIGVQGLADVFMKLGLSFDSAEARYINKCIFEFIYFSAVQASMQLAKDHGSYEGFEGSPASCGKLQMDLWEVEPITHTPSMWQELRDSVRIHGLRNSLLIALMPTASTASITGNVECFEPITSNAYTRRVLSGDRWVINKHLVSDLKELGLWNEALRIKLLADNGSVQNLPVPQHIKDVYRTVWEIPQKSIVQMAADRGPFICQSQSMNIHLTTPSYTNLSAMHFDAWRKGLKTGSYYIRGKAALNNLAPTVQEVEGCSLDDPSCESCSA